MLENMKYILKVKGNIHFLSESFIGENTSSILYTHTHTHTQRKGDKEGIVFEDKKRILF